MTCSSFKTLNTCSLFLLWLGPSNQKNFQAHILSYVLSVVFMESTAEAS